MDIPNAVKASFERMELSAIAGEDVLIVALVFGGLVKCIEHERLNLLQGAFCYVFYRCKWFAMGVCEGCCGVCSRRCCVIVNGHSRTGEVLGVRAIFFGGR